MKVKLKVDKYHLQRINCLQLDKANTKKEMIL